MANSFSYCLISAFLGSVRMRRKASLSKGSSEVIMGKRPMISGISPNFFRSAGEMCLSTSSLATSERSPFLKPTARLCMRREMIFSMPSKAPPQMNRILRVSIFTYFCSGCFLPPSGATLATVPSKIFSRPCCTPSPLTSRVMEGLSPLRLILSISSR